MLDQDRFVVDDAAWEKVAPLLSGRLVGALLLEQSDEWATQRSRYMTLETMTAVSDTPDVSLPVAAT